MQDLVVAAGERQQQELERFLAGSDAFCEQDAAELRSWFWWRTGRLVKDDLRVLEALQALEQERGEPFSARWTDVSQVAEGVAYARLGVVFNRLEHAGVVERLGRDRRNWTVWRLNHPASPEDAAVSELRQDLDSWAA